MFDHIKGKIAELAPTHVVVEANGVGYLINISLNTFAKIKDSNTEQKILTHLIVREDAMILYGFYDDAERQLFKHLISVSGVGPNTARMILSSLQPSDIFEAIVQKNHILLQSVKGIGAKSAQRIIVELQDKLAKENIESDFLPSQHNTSKQETLSALIVLGFNKMQIEKVLNKIISENPNLSAEEMIRQALKML